MFKVSHSGNSGRTHATQSVLGTQGCVAVMAVVLALFAVPVSTSSAQLAQQDWVSSWALNGRTEQQVAKQLQGEYKMQIKLIDQICDLNELQHRKLSTAGEGDVKRFLRDVERIRNELKDKEIDNNNVQEAWNIVSPLATKLQQGMFKENSLFAKVTKSALTDQQRKVHEEHIERSRTRRWKVLTRVNLAAIEQSMPLLEDQREKLLELLDAQKVNPKRISIHMEGYIGYLRLLKIEKKALKGFLDEHQLAVVDEYRQRYRGWENMLE